MAAFSASRAETEARRAAVGAVEVREVRVVRRDLAEVRRVVVWVVRVVRVVSRVERVAGERRAEGGCLFGGGMGGGYLDGVVDELFSWGAGSAGALRDRIG